MGIPPAAHTTASKGHTTVDTHDTTTHTTGGRP